MTRLGIHRRGGVEGSAPTPATRPRDRAGGREMNFVFTDDAVFAAQRARERVDARSQGAVHVRRRVVHVRRRVVLVRRRVGLVRRDGVLAHLAAVTRS